MGPWDHPRIQLVQLIDYGFALALLEDKQSLAREDCNVPKSNMHANPKSEMHANPKSDIHDISIILMMHALFKSSAACMQVNDKLEYKVTCMQVNGKLEDKVT